MNASVRAASKTDVGAERTRWSGKDRTARLLPVRTGCVAITCVCWASCGIASPSPRLAVGHHLELDDVPLHWRVHPGCGWLAKGPPPNDPLGFCRASASGGRYA